MRQKLGPRYLWRGTIPGEYDVASAEICRVNGVELVNRGLQFDRQIAENSRPNLRTAQRGIVSLRAVIIRDPLSVFSNTVFAVVVTFYRERPVYCFLQNV